MKVSIIVPIYNGSDILPITLPALLAQDYPRDLTEIILIDDGSDSETIEVLKNPDWRNECKIIHHLKNRGLAATRNSGIDAATGELLIFVDCDIEVQPDFVSRHVQLHGDSKIIGILSNILTHALDTRDKFHRYIFFGKRGARVVGENKPLPFNYFILGCTSVKAHVLKKTGKFNDNLTRYGGEDLEFAYRLWKNYPSGLFWSSKIRVYMHKIKTLEEALSDFREYGHYNVPVILEEFPELAHYVVANFVRSSQANATFKSTIGMLVFTPVIDYLAKKILKVTPYPMSNLLIRYLLAAAIVKGYRKALRGDE